MTSRWIVLWFIINMNRLGECLQCFGCESTENPACGISFKAYQYEAKPCTEAEHAKCGLQRQPKTADGHYHILRACYYLGQWPGMNESDGCHFITLADDETLEFCLCSDDFCNASSHLVSNALPVILCASFVQVLLAFYR